MTRYSVWGAIDAQRLHVEFREGLGGAGFGFQAFLIEAEDFVEGFVAGVFGDLEGVDGLAVAL